jgi:superfamily II DNA or RNA helicase
MNNEVLRDYQQEMLDRLHEAWKRYQSVMVQMPAGTGKTHLIAAIIKERVMAEERGMGNGAGVLVVAHRVELIDQISQTLDAFGIGHGVIGRTTVDIDKVMREHQVVVASIQTLARRKGQGHTDSTESTEKIKGHTDSTDSTDFLSPAERKEIADNLRSRRNEGNKGNDATQRDAKNEGNDATQKLVIVDEAHHAVAKTYRMLWEWWPEAKFLGLTATPCRLNQTGFTDLFETLLVADPIQTFIDKGWLSDFEYVSVTPDNWLVDRIAGLKKRGVDGDYQTKEMATVMDTPESIEHLYNSYVQYAKGKKGIVYAISREHARHIAEYYASRGVRCCWIDAMTPAEERQRIVEAYKGLGHTDSTDSTDFLRSRRNEGNKGNGSSQMTVEGHTDSTDSTDFLSPAERKEIAERDLKVLERVDVIVNVDIFSEGFDCPEVEFIQLARPTLSLSKYLQQVGRGMRRVPNKDYVMILDQVGMYQTFGIPTEDQNWELMFKGKAKGMGKQGGDHGYVIRDDNDLTLLNLQMVRIKRHGEKNIGVEIFMKGGRYGILNDGRVTCAAEFEHIRRIKNGGFFAIATYPYNVFKGKTTIISLTGMDLRASLYGKVTPHGEVFEGETIAGQQTFWDSVGQQYYSTQPVFEEIGGVEMVRRNGRYLPRKRTMYLREPVAKEDIWYNRHVLWMKGVVIVKETGQVFPIKAYGDDSFFVESNDYSKGQFMRIGLDGTIVYTHLLTPTWSDVYLVPTWGRAQLVRASSGQLEFMDKDYEQKKKVKVFSD